MDNNKKKFLDEVSKKISEINGLIKKHKLENDVIGSIVIGVLDRADYEDMGYNLKAVYVHMVDNSDELDAINEFSLSAYESDNDIDISKWFSNN